MTPLSQTRRDKLQEQYSSPSSSPRLRKKLPKGQANERDRLSLLVAQPKINIDDPEDFPPMGSHRYRKITACNIIEGLAGRNGAITIWPLTCRLISLKKLSSMLNLEEFGFDVQISI